MVTSGGAKLLDFGLSKSQPAPSVPLLATVSPDDAPLTSHGAVLGTFPYMAPEQLEGREADVRTDVFAFGATIYEMTTGQRAFQGDTAATLIGAILHTDPPPLSALQPLAPPSLDRIVSRCLAKLPDDRWQTARDLMLELRAIAEGTAPLSARRSPTKLAAAMSAVIAMLVLAAAVVYPIATRRAPGFNDSSIRLTFSPPEGVRLADLVDGRACQRCARRRTPRVRRCRSRGAAACLGTRTRVTGGAAVVRKRGRRTPILVPRQSVHRILRSAEAEDRATVGRLSANAV